DQENEDIPMPAPIPKKKRTIKKRPKLILVESSDENKVVSGGRRSESEEDRLKSSTKWRTLVKEFGEPNLYVTNTQANGKK
ncbi:MAG: hypothetical protein WCJ72_12095, partial [Chryseobacterium sp.]